MQKLESLLVAILGLVVIVDGWRMADNFRSGGGFGVVGPDRYLFGLGIALVIVSIVYLFFGSTPHSKDVDEDAPPDARGPLRAVLYGVATIAYAGVLPLVGYAVSTLLFFIAAFYIGDSRRWWPCVVAGVVATFAAYFLFVIVAGVTFPDASFSISYLQSTRQI